MTIFKLNIERFLAGLPVRKDEDDEKYIVTEDTVNMYLVDLMNETGVDTELRYKDGLYFVYAFGQEVISMFPLEPSDPTGSLVNATKWLVNEFGERKDINAWYTYKQGQHYFTVEKVPVPEDE